MTYLREQAVEILQNFPEEEMPYVVDILKVVAGIIERRSTEPTQTTASPTDADNLKSKEAIKESWERFKAYKGIIPYDIDTKAELAKTRNEKYADFI